MPFAALTKFYDPSVAFGLMFDPDVPDIEPEDDDADAQAEDGLGRRDQTARKKRNRRSGQPRHIPRQVSLPKRRAAMLNRTRNFSTKRLWGEMTHGRYTYRNRQLWPA